MQAEKAPRGKDRPLDAAGAEKLRWRIEQQQHWRQAPAVLDGRQPSIDPDLNDLVELGDGLRIYSSRITRGCVVQVYKRLVDGVWEHGTVEERFESGAATVIHA